MGTSDFSCHTFQQGFSYLFFSAHSMSIGHICRIFNDWGHLTSFWFVILRTLPTQPSYIRSISRPYNIPVTITGTIHRPSDVPASRTDANSRAVTQNQRWYNSGRGRGCAPLHWRRDRDRLFPSPSVASEPLPGTNLGRHATRPRTRPHCDGGGRNRARVRQTSCARRGGDTGSDAQQDSEWPVTDTAA